MQSFFCYFVVLLTRYLVSSAHFRLDFTKQAVDADSLREDLLTVASMIARLPNLQDLRLILYDRATVEVDLNCVFDAFSRRPRRRLLFVDIDAPWRFAEISPHIMARLGEGLRIIDVQYAEELGCLALESLLTGASQSLRDLALPHVPHLSIPTTPKLQSFTLMSSSGGDLTSILTRHPDVAHLHVAGNYPNNMRAAPSLTALTLELQLSVDSIWKNVTSLPNPALLRELHLSLEESSSHLELREVFLALPALEDLSISGWFRANDLGTCVLHLDEGLDPWTQIKAIQSQVRLRFILVTLLSLKEEV